MRVSYTKVYDTLVRKSEQARFITHCGYRIAAIMGPCQGPDRGSTPLTRSKIKQDAMILFYF
ncbi:MAG: hypothetical protein UY44_C0003G0002 [Candidatus Kaiserbacteria bacterium GW2011_GWA2_49_19]|uniref:Uncharacterized protein n=1 Tax=Candidatus Kaiserbacteria bacterium GW2011_GWA2_49_19 TaxID=1618669 RepID=A0A0G1YSH0_9BACT|nr:MAG: hypothetical protein UY44_C0003G0002 [Candidatus Kaiserbacteria bacterium GW2011_GWA2_49_19]